MQPPTPLPPFVEDAGLAALLKDHSLECYMPLFARHHVDMDAFLLLHEAHLEALGVTLLGPRLKLAALIEQCRARMLAVQQGESAQDDGDGDRDGGDMGDDDGEGKAKGGGGEGKGGGRSEVGSGGQSPVTVEVAGMPSATLHTLRRTARLTEAGVPTAPVFNVDELQMGRWNDREVAIKRLATTSPDEGNLLCQFRHRNIVQCLGACYQPPHHVLVMEYAPENLKQAIHSHDITPSTLIDWSLQIATGMNYLHAEAPITVIHRDLKPANILVFPGAILKITDFGLSRVRESPHVTSDTMSTVGTFEYMAPEVIKVVKSNPYTEKADIYSYGVVVWEMLTKQAPYHGLPSLAVGPWRAGIQFAANRQGLTTQPLPVPAVGVVLAFGVGSGTLRLPIPSNCPPGIAAMLESCWTRDFHLRPSFRELITTMDTIGSSEFASVPYCDFRRLRSDWGAELVVRPCERDGQISSQIVNERRGTAHARMTLQTIFEQLKLRESAVSAAEQDVTEYQHNIQRERALEGAAHLLGIQLERAEESAAHRLAVDLERAREGAAHHLDVQLERAKEGAAHQLGIQLERAEEGEAHRLGIELERAEEGAVHRLDVQREREEEGAAHQLGVELNWAQEGAAHQLDIQLERAQEGEAHRLAVELERAKEGAAHQLDVQLERAQEGEAHRLAVELERAKEGAAHQFDMQLERAKEGAAHDLGIQLERAEEGEAHRLGIELERAEEGAVHRLDVQRERDEEGAAHQLGIEIERAKEGAAHQLDIQLERAQEGEAHRLAMKSERAKEGAAHQLDIELERAKEGVAHQLGVELERAEEGEAHRIGMELERAEEGEAHRIGMELERAKEGAAHELGIQLERAKEGAAHQLDVQLERAKECAAHQLDIQLERAKEDAAHQLDTQLERAKEGAAHDLGIQLERAEEGEAHRLGIELERAEEGAVHRLDVQRERDEEGAAHQLGIEIERAKEGAAHQLDIQLERAQEGEAHRLAMELERAREGAAHDLDIQLERVKEGAAHRLDVQLERAKECAAHQLDMQLERAKEDAAHQLDIQLERAKEDAAHDVGIRRKRAIEGATHRHDMNVERAKEGAAHRLHVQRERADEVEAYHTALQQQRAKAEDVRSLEQESFVDVICHGIRNPLNVIVNSLDQLHDGRGQLQHKIQRLLDRMPQEAEVFGSILEQLGHEDAILNKIDLCALHQRRVTDAVAHISSLKLGQCILGMSVFAVDDVVQSAIAKFRAECYIGPVDVEYSAASPGACLLGDPARISQILADLLFNTTGITTTPSLETTHVTSRVAAGLDAKLGPDARTLVLSVQTARTVGPATEPASLLSSAVGHRDDGKMAYTSYGGFGLGLFVTKELLGLMDGRIRVESAAVTGTTFTIEIPLRMAPFARSANVVAGFAQPVHVTVPGSMESALFVETSASAMGTPVNAAVMVEAARRRTPPRRSFPLAVLVVDDNDLNLAILAQQLEAVRGNIFTVTTASNGQEAVRSVSSAAAVDLIFMDVEMPGMSGLEATRAIRRYEDGTGQVPVLIVGVSGNARQEHIDEALASGMDDYIVKPYSRGAMFALICRILGADFLT